MSDRWAGLTKTPMGGLDAISVPNGEFITYSRSSDAYELLLTNFVEDTGHAWFDFYVENQKALEVTLVHPRDGLAANGYDWDDREDSPGDFIHVSVTGEEDGEAAPFGVITFTRSGAAKMALEIIDMLKATEKED